MKFKNFKINRKTAIIIGAAALLVIIIIGYFYIFMKRDFTQFLMSDRDYFLTLVKREARSFNPSLTDNLDNIINMNNPEVNPTNIEFDIKANLKLSEKYEASPYYGISALGMKGTAKSGVIDGVMANTVESDVSVSGSELFSLGLYADSETFGIKVPEVYDRQIMFNMRNFNENNPLYSDMFGPLFCVAFDRDIFLTFLNDSTKIFIDHAMDVRITHNDSSTVVGLRQDYDRVTLSLSGEELHALLTALADNLKNNEGLAAMLDEAVYKNRTGLSELIDDSAEPENYAAFCDALIKWLDDNSSSIKTDTFEYTLFVDSMENIVGRELILDSKDTSRAAAMSYLFANHGLEVAMEGKFESDEKKLDALFNGAVNNGGITGYGEVTRFDRQSPAQKTTVLLQDFKREKLGKDQVMTGEISITNLFEAMDISFAANIEDGYYVNDLTLDVFGEYKLDVAASSKKNGPEQIEKPDVPVSQYRDISDPSAIIDLLIDSEISDNLQDLLKMTGIIG